MPSLILEPINNWLHYKRYRDYLAVKGSFHAKLQKSNQARAATGDTGTKEQESLFVAPEVSDLYIWAVSPENRWFIISYKLIKENKENRPKIIVICVQIVSGSDHLPDPDLTRQVVEDTAAELSSRPSFWPLTKN